MPELTGLHPSQAAAVQAIVDARIASAAAVTPQPLRRWKKALGNVLAGVSDARIAFLGDSTTAGAGATYWRQATPAIFAKLLAAQGIPVNANSVFGSGVRTQGATYTAFDPRVSFTGSWNSTGAGFSTIGGAAIYNGGLGSGTYNFTPTDPVTGAAYAFDTIDVYYCALDSGGGTFTISVDGGAAIGAAVATTSARALALASRSCTLAGHTVNITATVAGTIYILGILCSNSAQKTVRVFNLGGGSYQSADYVMGTIGDYTCTAALTNNALAAPLAPHLAIVDVGVNDRNSGGTTTTFMTNMRSLLSRLQTVGSDIILCKPMATQLAFNAYTGAERHTYFDNAIAALAAEYSIPVIYDKRTAFGSYETAQPLGLYADTVHPSPAGYAYQALDLLPLVTS